MTAMGGSGGGAEREGVGTERAHNVWGMGRNGSGGDMEESQEPQVQ